MTPMLSASLVALLLGLTVAVAAPAPWRLVGLALAVVLGAAVLTGMVVIKLLPFFPPVLQAVLCLVFAAAVALPCWVLIRMPNSPPGDEDEEGSDGGG
ncbi:MAG: hypothetical protein M3296_11175, partial [Actinomycetota bacterium]|nr:hypothetical protein [Actinomycetota bacterium]